MVSTEIGFTISFMRYMFNQDATGDLTRDSQSLQTYASDKAGHCRADTFDIGQY